MAMFDKHLYVRLGAHVNSDGINFMAGTRMVLDEDNAKLFEAGQTFNCYDNFNRILRNVSPLQVTLWQIQRWDFEDWSQELINTIAHMPSKTLIILYEDNKKLAEAALNALVNSIGLSHKHVVRHAMLVSHRALGETLETAGAPSAVFIAQPDGYKMNAKKVNRLLDTLIHYGVPLIVVPRSIRAYFVGLQVKQCPESPKAEVLEFARAPSMSLKPLTGEQPTTWMQQELLNKVKLDEVIESARKSPSKLEQSDLPSNFQPGHAAQMMLEAPDWEDGKPGKTYDVDCIVVGVEFKMGQVIYTVAVEAVCGLYATVRNVHGSALRVPQ